MRDLRIQAAAPGLGTTVRTRGSRSPRACPPRAAPVASRPSRRRDPLRGQTPGKTHWISRRRTGGSRSRRTNSIEVAAVLGRTLDSFNVPERKKQEVLAAFAAQ